MQLTVPRRFLMLIALFGFATASQGQEDPASQVTALVKLDVGGQTVVISPPPGFARADGINPRWDEIVTSTMMPTNHALAAFLSTEDVEVLRSGRVPQPTRFFDIQILKSIEHQDLGEKAFADMRGGIRQGIDQSQTQADAILKREAGNLNHIAKDQYGIDTALKFSNSVLLGYFDESPSSLGFTRVTKARFRALSGELTEKKLVTATLVFTVNNRLLNLYAHAEYTGEADRQWVEKSASYWRDAIAAANPHPPGPSAEEFLAKNHPGAMHTPKAAHSFFDDTLLREILSALAVLTGVLIVLVMGDRFAKRKNKRPAG